MPLYEYRCEQDGTLIELMRPMAEADAPVEDPDEKGRTFTRVLSVLRSGGSTSPTRERGSSGTASHVHSGSCGCGRPRGSCSN